MTYTTTTERDRAGKLSVKTVIPLGADRRELHITTRRNSVRGGIQCGARVEQVSEDGRSYTHAFSFGSGGDYSKTLAHDIKGRATEKALTTMHAAAMLDVEAVIAAAKAHYADAPAKTTGFAASSLPMATPRLDGADAAG